MATLNGKALKEQEFYNDEITKGIKLTLSIDKPLSIPCVVQYKHKIVIF